VIAAQRRAMILAELERTGSVRVSDLVDILEVSDMTIRRDLDLMQSQNLLDKVHGGAVVRAEPATSEPGFEVKSARRMLEKEAIAQHAATLVHPGSAIAVSAGTTTHTFARHLVDIPELTVVTNSVWVAEVFYRHGVPSRMVLLTGGQRTPSDALVGPLAIAALDSLHLDAAFMGVHGMDARAGFSSPNLLEAETNRAMIRSARRLIVLADSTKWGVVGLSSMAALGDATVVVSDGELSQGARESLSERTELELVAAAQNQR
jgi:DeoR/GlpR family transcriptional regulator of sugar metabolism